MPNQRVSLEEVRAKRLAKEAEEGKTVDNKELVPIPPDESRPEPTAPLEAQQPGQSPDVQSVAEAAPEPAPDAVLSPVKPTANFSLRPTDAGILEDFLISATPDQLQKLRVLAAADGLASGIQSTGSAKLPDGSMTVTVHLDAPITEQLEIWAEADGCSLVEEAQKRISESLTNYLYGDWNPIVEQPPVAAATATTTTAATK
jgi:hypothetical protein